MIPLAVYSAWVLELFLLAGSEHIFLRFDPSGIFLYTLIAGIITGMIAPLVCIRIALLSGAVNMFQIGFRTFRRTLLACSVTCTIGIGMVVLFNPFGADRLAFANAFLLLLPTAASSVMVCWVLCGTHLQAFVRSGGALLSITTGVVITSLLFATAALAISPSVREEGTTFWPIFIGLGAAFFFFAVRDVYATAIMVTGSGVFFGAGTLDYGYLHGIHPQIYVSSLLAVVVLIALHFYLSRNYATIVVPAEP